MIFMDSDLIFDSSLLISIDLRLRRPVVVSLHGVRLATARLPIGEDRGVVALDHFGHQAMHLELFVDLLLAAARVEDGT